MTDPLVFVPGIGFDAGAWRGMPEGEVISSSATTIEDMAREVLDRAPPRFALAAHSMGGYVALAMLALAPHRVSRLALISSSAAADTSEQQARRVQSIEQARGNFGKVARSLASAVLSPASRQDDALVAEVTEMILRCGEANFIRQQTAALHRGDFRPALGRIAIPALVIHGEQDRVVPCDRGEELADGIANSAFQRIRHCGHLPQREAEGATRTLLEQWFGSQASGPIESCT